MKNFDYAAPTSLDVATSLLAGSTGPARLLAGGTDLLVQLRERLRDAELVVDLKKIPQLMELSFTPSDGLRLGASVPCYRIYEDAGINAAYPALADATRIVGGWQIQSRASVGGNLCNSSPAGDTIPPLIVLDARCQIVGPDGRRELRAEAFCTGPGTNVLQRGEILTTLVLPPPMPHAGSAYERFIPRNEMDIAVVGAAAWVSLDSPGEIIEHARIALAAVAPRPVLAVEASRWLEGRPATAETFARAGELARQAASPISDMRGTAEFRTHLVGVLVKRTLATAVQRARQRH
ncbi:MAG: xanthine dehydrogenase family protein subunit M [Isosphaeraceae bacterium]